MLMEIITNHCNAERVFSVHLVDHQVQEQILDGQACEQEKTSYTIQYGRYNKEMWNTYTPNYVTSKSIL